MNISYVLCGRITRCGMILLLCGLPLCTSVLHAADEVNVYSARKEQLIKPLLERFTEQTGIEVNLLSAEAGALLTRLRNEQRNTPADMLITVDAGNLQRAVEADVLQPVTSEMLSQVVPAHLRHPDGLWYALSVRSRVIFRHRERVPADAINSYAQLADPAWRGRICIRSSDNIYNQSLVAALIEHQGEAATEAWAEGVVANLARSPRGGDTDQLLAVAAGECDLAVANTYYYARMLNDPQQKVTADKLAVVWPDQDGHGAHVNISGAAITRHAPHPEAARQLLEFLLSESSQQWYAEVNNEYPVREDVAASEVLRDLGEFNMDQLNLSVLGKNNAAAVMLMDRAGWR